MVGEKANEGASAGTTGASAHAAGMARLALVVAAWLATGVANAQDAPTYRCPNGTGTGSLYTNTISANEAVTKGCKTLDNAPITVIQTTKPRPTLSATPPPMGGATSGAPRSADTRVSSADQKSRDTDARRILEGELRREQESLAGLQKDYNNGEPERQGNERNYQKYIDRVAEMKAAIDRRESDIAAIKRELGKLPPPQ
jgi:hypothetical protein